VQIVGYINTNKDHFTAKNEILKYRYSQKLLLVYERWRWGSSWKYSVTCFSIWPLDDCRFWRGIRNYSCSSARSPFSNFPFPTCCTLYLFSWFVIFYIVLFSCFIDSSLCSPSPDSPPYITVLSSVTVHATVQAGRICWNLSEDQFWSWYVMYGICCRATGSGKEFFP
jgi:hypothetical protein